MIEFLTENSLLLLFSVAAVGYAIGRIKIKGASLGVAAILFVGLAVGALNPNLKLPTVIFELGLVLFVYTVGLASGPGFFASFKRKGLRDNLAALAVLSIAALIAAAEFFALKLSAPVTAGLFAGALTNTPALAAVIETVGKTAPADVDLPTVGYSVAYPMGVLATILVAFVLQRVWKIDYRQEARKLRGGIYPVEQEIYNQVIRVTNPEAAHDTVDHLVEQHNWHIVFGRMQRGDEQSIVAGDTQLALGDLVSVIGSPEDIEDVIPHMGEVTDVHLELDRSHYDFRRIFVSKA